MAPHDKFLEEVRGNIACLASAGYLHELSRTWILETSKYKYSYNFAWLGRPIIQYPQDIVAMQELIWRVKPDLIIETGIAHGGSLIFSASMLALLDYCEAAAEGRSAFHAESRRRVLGIDIEIRPHNRSAIEAHPLACLINTIEGSSIDSAVVSQVKAIARNHHHILVCLDSNHTCDHVLAELQAYAPLVSPESYCVAFDTIIERMPADLYATRPWGPGNSPMTAVERFLSTLADGSVLAADGARLMFEADSRIDNKLMISVAPKGYLRRISITPDQNRDFPSWPAEKFPA